MKKGSHHTKEANLKNKLAHIGKKMPKHTEEYKQRSSERVKQEWKSGKRKGGWKLSEETKKKISEKKKGKPFSGKPFTWKGIKGKNHPAWIKDRTKLKRRDERNDYAYQNWVKQVKKRDNNTCRINNKDCSGHCIVHHILPWRDYPELRYEINNGITLCLFHHPRKRAEEKKLIPFFQELVEVKEHF